MRKQKCLYFYNLITTNLIISFQANLLSTSVQEYNYRIDDTLKRISKLQSALEEWERKAEDLPRLGEIVWGAGDVVAEVKRRVTPRLTEVRDMGLRCRLMLEVYYIWRIML